MSCGTTKQAYKTTNGINVVDTARYKCTYQFTFLRDSVKMTYNEDLNVIQIGENFTKSYCYQAFYVDSMDNTPDGRGILATRAYEVVVNQKSDVGIWSMGIFKFNVYKDYQKEKLTVIDKVSTNPFIYEEELKPQDWIILEDTMTIIGYSCQKAKCSFRGRDWEAWFTPEIPINEGPYKFYGLPGLIMKLKDTESHYYFELKGFEKVAEPIYMTVYSHYRATDRLSFLKLLMNRTGTDLEAMDWAKIGIISGGSAVKHYDHIERDYK